MRNRHAIARIAASAGLLLLAAQAQAQTKYYARERIVGVPASAQSSNPPAAYDGTWSTGAWTDSGRCSGSVQPQTRTVSCTGTSCDPGTKPASTMSAACTRTNSCGANMLEGGSFSAQSFVSSTKLKATRDLNLDWCETYATAKGCQATATTVYAVAKYDGQYVPTPQEPARWSATCAKP